MKATTKKIIQLYIGTGLLMTSIPIVIFSDLRYFREQRKFEAAQKPAQVIRVEEINKSLTDLLANNNVAETEAIDDLLRERMSILQDPVYNSATSGYASAEQAWERSFIEERGNYFATAVMCAGIGFVLVRRGLQRSKEEFTTEKSNNP